MQKGTIINSNSKNDKEFLIVSSASNLCFCEKSFSNAFTCIARNSAIIDFCIGGFLFNFFTESVYSTLLFVIVGSSCDTVAKDDNICHWKRVKTKKEVAIYI
jgi:hypothetical protein